MAASFACIILAAGRSTRFGGDKRQIKSDAGQTLLDLTLKSIPPTFQQRLLVLHPGDEALGATYEKTWHVIYAGMAIHGMGHSIAAAISQIGDCTAALIVLADMPLVLPETYISLQQAAKPDRIVIPFFAKQRGNPVMIGSQFFPQLSELKGDSGARQLMHQHPELVERLDVTDPGVLRDVDTVEELLLIPGFGEMR